MRRWWRPSLALFIVGLLCILAGEIVIRLAIGPPARMLYGFGQPFHDVQTDWDIIYGEKSDGTRVTCGAETISGTAPRIAVIGDSFVFGQGVEDCADLVSQLSIRVPSHRFYNLGLIGAGIEQYILVVRDLLVRYDGVIVVFFGNDVGRFKWNQSLIARLSRHSSLAALVRKAYHVVIVRQAVRAWRAAARAGAEGTEKIALMDGRPNNILSALRNRPDHYKSMVEPDPRLVALFRERFSLLASLLEQRVGRERVLVTMVPQGHTVSKRLRDLIVENGGMAAPFNEPGPAYELVQSLAREHGFRFIDVYPHFVEAGDTLYHPHDLHWSSAGHWRMADVLAEEIKSSRPGFAVRASTGLQHGRGATTRP